MEVLHEWYQLHRRELPWRDLWNLDEQDRAYRVWISEVMLQQTQVSRVIGSYKKFVQQFPTLHDLAKASNAEILIAWRGMGYNSRALRLRDGARVMVRGSLQLAPHHDNAFPQAMEALMSIKGIGAYTAGAIRTFAFDLPTPVIDTNIRRILHRTFVGPENADGTWRTDDKKLGTLMSMVMDAWIAAGHRGSDLLSALMDYGSLVQTKSNPQWEICVLTDQNIMKTTPRQWAGRASRRGVPIRRSKTEPGRMVGAAFIPNRIFRGRIVEALRDHPNGLKIGEIAKWISPDAGQEPKGWLEGLIKKLEQEKMIQKRNSRYVLAQ